MTRPHFKKTLFGVSLGFWINFKSNLTAWILIFCEWIVIKPSDRDIPRYLKSITLKCGFETNSNFIA